MSGYRTLRVDLDPKLVEDLETVRSHLGLKNDSEVIRYLIREKARELRRSQAVASVEVEG